MASENIRLSEHHMRIGAFRSFDINEAIKTSDRRIAEKALKNTVPVEEEPGDSEPALASEFTQNYLELNYRITARLFWALFCGLTFLAFCSDLFQNETGFVKGLDSQAVRLRLTQGQHGHACKSSCTGLDSAFAE